ncbi:hypothetical protein Tco_1321563 [Tanacetum coccineum]
MQYLQGAVRLCGKLDSLFLHPMFQNLKKKPDKPGGDVNGKSVKSKFRNTAQCPSRGKKIPFFQEFPKPKAKKTDNLDPNPNSYQSKLPYPERMKVREHDKPSAQHSRFLKMFKQLRLEIGLKDALVEMQFNKWLSSLLRNKEKLEEIRYPTKLELEALTPTRMTLELANRSISHPMGIAEDVVVRVDVGKDELVYYADKSEKNKEKNFVHAISVIDFSKDDPFSGSTTPHSDDPSPSSSPVKTSDNFEKFADELAPLDSLPPGNDDSTLKKDLHEENFQEDGNFIKIQLSSSSIFLSLFLIEDSEPTQKRIDILLVPIIYFRLAVDDADSR